MKKSGLGWDIGKLKWDNLRGVTQNNEERRINHLHVVKPPGIIKKLGVLEPLEGKTVENYGTANVPKKGFFFKIFVCVCAF